MHFYYKITEWENNGIKYNPIHLSAYFSTYQWFCVFDFVMFS